MEKVNYIILQVVAIVMLLQNCSQLASAAQVPAMWVFGDSIVDDGNNNYLSSLAKANYRPYGVDFFQGPTGRFTNGKTVADFLGQLLGLPYIPAFSDPGSRGQGILRGVNYASAAAGILEETGRNYVSAPLIEDVAGSEWTQGR
ncbi:hypothetical protein H6P81_001554 [Aristolochia fimbriata]|uniref:GDSL esterase/lipase n=1 Tax=Aristolochia fimbriata TaxID=158543 RepID=A0AAV7FAF4_ARIFI|nr:hypothetical protein H6P81_001554 [Aristolochia fimbriata]